jgi:CheY-like chemotaxis protein
VAADSNHSQKTILAVDDDPTVLEMLEQILGSAGYHVLAAGSGRAAIEKFEQQRHNVDLLLIDVIMPDLTGPVVAERLRALRPGLPVLFISGFHDADLVQRFAALKGFTLLPKPFRRDALLRTVEEKLA